MGIIFFSDWQINLNRKVNQIDRLIYQDALQADEVVTQKFLIKVCSIQKIKDRPN
jgi:hypothetical protein